MVKYNYFALNFLSRNLQIIFYWSIYRSLSENFGDLSTGSFKSDRLKLSALSNLISGDFDFIFLIFFIFHRLNEHFYSIESLFVEYMQDTKLLLIDWVFM